MFAPLVPLGVVAMVLLLVRAAQVGDSDGWLCAVFAGLGFGVLAGFRGYHPTGLLSAALLGVATWYASRGLWSPAPPVEAADRLLGENLPGTGHYTTFLLLVLSTLGTIAASVLARRHRSEDWDKWPTGEPGAARRLVALLVAGAVLIGVAWLGGGIWASRTADAVLTDSEDHTTAAEAPDPRPEPPRGPTQDLTPVWQVGDDVRYGDQAALVPGTDMVVMHGFEAGVGTDYGLFVLDAKTGGERWHYRIRSTENTSPGGFMGVVVNARTQTLLAVVSNVAVLFDLDTGQIRSRFPLPPVPGKSRYRILSDSPVRNDRTVIQLSSQPVGFLTARGEGVATLLSVDLDTGEVRTADQAPNGECHYQLAGSSTTDSQDPGGGVYLVRSGRGCGRPVVLSMTRERVVATFELPTVEQAATTCTEPDCDGPVVSVADGRLVVNVGRELRAFGPDRPLWTSPVPEGAQVTAVGPSTGETSKPRRVVVETPTGTTVLNGDTGAVLGPLAALPGTGNGGEVTPDTGWYRVHRLDKRTIELVRVDLGSLTVVTRSEPVPCGTSPATDPPPLSAGSGRLLVTCWEGREATMTMLGR
ncbi:hypothetical protein ALI144C_00175 [Actinosynnema sp. ALI-1.44]|uniref:PQQ-binding-like beta-propeller repeat protein n=1 Tax=Actinosynnema sp. ALI-1.44 TaxID=1933779 RepID=UPI00097C6350|nr:PQQ-binding-like beta-propeller repeat protein [Actinosynnema sp. ALI-1.44]ONI91979.1 hypothetical protein ALI144C_00175 [Actinosynnema sp. ALI-1.44]